MHGVTQVSNIEDKSSGKPYGLAKIAFALGLGLVTADNFFYALNKAQFAGTNQAAYVYSSLLMIVAASICFAASASSYVRAQRRFYVEPDSKQVRWSLGWIVSEAFYERKRLLLSSILLYAIFFSFIDAILVYQPTVNFFTAYVVSGPTWRVATCCGPPGYIPIGFLYLPAEHFGIQLIPISVLLMVCVSILVGLNVTLLYRAYVLSSSKTASSSKGTIGSMIGAGLGLFAGCPTCAATFLLSTIAGTGSIALAGYIFAYQPLIVALTLPLLFFSILWQARSIRTILLGCAPRP